MGNHRAARAEARPSGSVTLAGGRRRAEKPVKKSRLRLPSWPAVLGVAALGIAGAGAVTTAESIIELSPTLLAAQAHRPSVASGTTATSSSTILAERSEAISRDASRSNAADAQDEKRTLEAEKEAEQFSDAMADVQAQAQEQSEFIAENAWVLPHTNYRLTAQFGEYGLWSSAHTGLDFAGDYGSPVLAIARGTITSAGYDGSYGNKLVLTLDDGTEIWYCHLSDFNASVGEVVNPGEVVGAIGMTGRTTGPHLHLEVRPGAGDPVNPYTAFIEHGITP